MPMTLCIGDGANDVPMILQVHTLLPPLSSFHLFGIGTDSAVFLLLFVSLKLCSRLMWALVSVATKACRFPPFPSPHWPHLWHFPSLFGFILSALATPIVPLDPIFLLSLPTFLPPGCSRLRLCHCPIPLPQTPSPLPRPLQLQANIHCHPLLILQKLHPGAPPSIPCPFPACVLSHVVAELRGIRLCVSSFSVL